MLAKCKLLCACILQVSVVLSSAYSEEQMIAWFFWRAVDVNPLMAVCGLFVHLVRCDALEQVFVIPAQAGVQSVEYWIPACAGMTIRRGTLV